METVVRPWLAAACVLTVLSGMRPTKYSNHRFAWQPPAPYDPSTPYVAYAYAYDPTKDMTEDAFEEAELLNVEGWLQR